MDARLQRRVQRYGWDRAVSHYERYWRAQLAPAQDALLELADLRPGERVLDIACGTGLVSIPAARAVGADGSLLGTDISRGMVEAAAAEAERHGLHQARFERMEAEALDVEEGAFDAALCGLGLMYVPEPIEAVREMRRAVRPGGRAVAAVWGARDRCGWAGIFPVVDARVNTEVCPMFFHLGTGETLARTFTAAGFEEVESVRISTRLEYATGEDAVGAAFAGGPVAMAYSRFDETTRDEAHDAYLETIAAYGRPAGGYDIPGEFVIVRGVRPA